MWTPCPTLLDEPARICGLEVGDFFVLLALPVLLAPVLDTWQCFAAGALAAGSFWYAKRGKPPGALFHSLHGLELLRWPGVLGPRPTVYSPW